MDNFPIDFIITWVDGNDPDWKTEKSKYKGTKGDSRNSRYRDWDTLRYLFRGIEKNAPWVNKVFLVTCGHLPSWINCNNSKLEIVKHSDYIPSQYLPTFSSRTIDMNFHRIDQLSDHFVYFNDDMLIMKPVLRKDFFVNGMPCDTAILRPATVKISRNSINETSAETYLAPIIDIALINKYFNKHKSISNNLFKWYSFRYGKEAFKTLTLAPWDFFPGIREYHCCYSYLKDTYRELWNLENSALSEVCSHRFRVNTDYNHWIFSYWQIAKGSFAPRTPYFGVAYTLNNDDNYNAKVFNILKHPKHKVICINDNVSDECYVRISDEFTKCLTEIFPEKSSFEV